tara:strand:+ start:5409 stop:5645 length:237 start_codon:yes stop_codon:yes gene_type:complete
MSNGKDSGWVNVEDRLPDVEGSYLLCAYHENPAADQWVGEAYASIDPVDGRFMWDDTEGFDYPGVVTHWMPLPEPPCG